MDRHAQLKALFGVDFPFDLFELWEWVQAFDEVERRTFADDLGMRLTGVCDVLAGSFDGIELRYPAVLHWRFHWDPPEFFTAISGDTDGLHWGLWFDDPGRLAPVVAGNYARDSIDTWSPGDTLLDTVRSWIDSRCESARENIDDDPGYADDYRESLDRMQALAATLPPSPTRLHPRRETHPTPEGMGIVVPPNTFDPELAVTEDEARLDAVARAQRFVADGLGGNALHLGRLVWYRDQDLGGRVLELAYEALGREPLVRVVRAHRAHPCLPRVDILEYRQGDYASFEEASAEPDRVHRLEVGGEGLTELPDLSRFVGLRELRLWGNALSSLPSTMAALVHLTDLNLFRNAFEVFPDVLARLPALVRITLGRNRVASIGDAIGDCPALEDLDLGDNELTALPDALGRVHTLRILNLANNPLTALPESLGRVPLRNLGAYRCELATLPSDLSGWAGLETAYLGENPLPASELDRLRVAAPNVQIN